MWSLMVAGLRPTAHQDAALQVNFHGPAGEIRAGDERNPVIHDDDLGVHGRTLSPPVGGPAQPGRVQPGRPDASGDVGGIVG
jgi:hypothetical protein